MRLRRWKARPLFAAAGVVTLALGIAATATIFSLTDAALFKPLPWRNPDNLVTIYVARPHWGCPR